MTWRDKLAQKANGMLPAGEYGMYLKRELLEIVAELDRLTADRDEARRNLCDLYVKGQPSSSSMTDKDYAAELGWDCFKEDGK
jgi:hypothetical protein